MIKGAGYGHGVGMSQEGALGYAEHGYSYQAILAHYYTGTALGTVSEADEGDGCMIGGKVHAIPLETYVRGVVGAEMPASWPLAALEAQAVASRTYALTDHAGGARFDVYADTRSQVYLGTKAHTAATNAAVAATAGQVVTYAGQPAITYFFASSGGMTESVQNAFPGAAPEPWLRGVPDPYDQGPRAQLDREHELRHRGGAPARPGERRVPRHRGAYAAATRRGSSPRTCWAPPATRRSAAPNWRNVSGWTTRGRTSACAPPTAGDRAGPQPLHDARGSGPGSHAPPRAPRRPNHLAGQRLPDRNLAADGPAGPEGGTTAGRPERGRRRRHDAS